MRDDSGDEDLARLVASLVRTLRELESELEPPEPGRGPRPPTPREVRRFASDVAIPGLILVLETNIRALRLLQRSLRLADDADRATESAGELRSRAESASETTLARLDDALADLQSAIEGRPDNEEAASLLDEARDLRAEVERRLDERARGNGASEEPSADTDDSEADAAAEGADESVDTYSRDDADEAVQVDVDAELQSIKSELDDGDDDPGLDTDDGSAPPEDGNEDDSAGPSESGGDDADDDGENDGSE